MTLFHHYFCLPPLLPPILSIPFPDNVFHTPCHLHSFCFIQWIENILCTPSLYLPSCSCAFTLLLPHTLPFPGTSYSPLSLRPLSTPYSFLPTFHLTSLLSLVTSPVIHVYMIMLAYPFLPLPYLPSFLFPTLLPTSLYLLPHPPPPLPLPATASNSSNSLTTELRTVARSLT